MAALCKGNACKYYHPGPDALSNRTDQDIANGTLLDDGFVKDDITTECLHFIHSSVFHTENDNFLFELMTSIKDFIYMNSGAIVDGKTEFLDDEEYKDRDDFKQKLWDRLDTLSFDDLLIIKEIIIDLKNFYDSLSLSYSLVYK